MKKIIEIYITVLPVILAGICNMIFIKTNFYKNHRKPIDGGKNVFGDNKTWLGAIFMILATTLFQVVLSKTELAKLNCLYIRNDNYILLNLFVGFLLGLAYIIFELPNSFIKRKLYIKPGKTANPISYFADQIDSAIGVTLILSIYIEMSIILFLEYIFFCSIIHSIINLILYALKIRKNI